MDKITQIEEEIKKSQLLMQVPFFQVPNFIFDKVNDLTEHELLVYIYLCRCGNQGGVAFPSLPTIGEKTKTSRATAARAVSGLIEKGYIIKHNRTGTSNIYKIFIDIDPGVVSERDGVVSERDGGVVSQGDPKKNYSFKKNHEAAGGAAEPSASKKELNHITNHYKELFEVYADIKPNIKDEELKALKLLLQEYGAEDIKNMITLLFQDTDPYWKREGYPLLVFAKQIRKFITRLAEMKKPAAKQENKSNGEALPFTVIYGSTSWEDHQARQRAIEREFVLDYEEPVTSQPAGADDVKAGLAHVKDILRSAAAGVGNH